MLPIRTVAYTLGKPPVQGSGLTWTAAERDGAVSESVAAVVYDDAGTLSLETMLSSLPDTGFVHINIKSTLQQISTVEGWRVGEALAECYLVEHRQCLFPWPDGRDARKRTASLPGADLVGFQQDKGGNHCFAFGEVKTSSEKKYLPGACHGTTGLKQQLEDLRDQEELRDDLVKYLGYRAANGAAWKQQYLQAAKRYFTDKCNVRVFGLLVRDVPPHEDDLRVRVNSLAKECPVSMAIELFAIYLPDKSIEELGKLTAQSRKGGVS